MSNEPSIPLVLALDDASATLEQVGGKGASLARMATAGLPVPPGFHITTAAYRRFVTENGLQEEILAAVAPVAADQPAALEEASRQIGQLFARSVMPDDIAGAIRQAYKEFPTINKESPTINRAPMINRGATGGDLPVAVRSSATAEDLPEMSFAGQQETYLNMRGEAMVLDAVKRCWASLWTANPLTGARDQVMINAAWGLGEAIVGGQVTPDSFVVGKASGKIIEQEITEKDVMTVRTLEGTHEEPVPVDKRTAAVLTAEQAAELARVGVQIEDLYGRPMDIEWALHNGHMSVVQARPITALPEPAAGSQGTRAAEWKLPQPKGHYMRGSVLELLPDPLSPLFATLGLPAFSRATSALLSSMGVANMFPTGELLTTINGYGYYDLTFTPAQTVKVALAMPRLFALMPRLFRTSQPRWQEERSQYAEVVKQWEAADLAATPAGALLAGARDIAEEAGMYYLSVQSGILPAAYMSESFFTLVYNRFLKGRNAPPALTFVLGFDSAPMQAERSLYDLAQWVREQPELAAALANMSSEQFTTAYREQAARGVAADGAWPEFWRRLADHLARFGHAIYDLDFAKAVLADDPAPVLETLKFFLSGQAPDPYKRRAAAEAAREQATETELKQRRGLRLRIFRNLVQRAQRYAPLREDALADAGLGWPVLRRMLRELGRRLVTSSGIDTPDDVFWLTLDELQEAATALGTGQSPADYHAIVAERRTTWESEHALTPPVALPLKGGTRFLGIDFKSMMPARTDQPKGDMLMGIAASPGQVTGPARVISGPGEFDQMRPGDILVARITTPAWTPLFALAAGVVTDVGGPLSHSSIVAREYHIPAVLGAGVATERLSSGQRITVDGDKGTVTVAS